MTDSAEGAQTTEKIRTCMVVLASEHLWPNLQGIVHWQEKEGGLSSVLIYYTGDEERSAKPAKRLSSAISKLFPGIHVPDIGPQPMMPEEVINRLKAWMSANPHDSWILNITGGTKLMTAGVLELAGTPDVRIIYRELQESWFEVGRIPWKGICTAPIRISPHETDGITLEILVEMQFVSGTGASWKFDKPIPLPVKELVLTGARNMLARMAKCPPAKRGMEIGAKAPLTYLTASSAPKAANPLLDDEASECGPPGIPSISLWSPLITLA